MPGAIVARPPLFSLAGRTAPKGLLVDLAWLECDYHTLEPNPSEVEQLVQFGTSGHRGSPLRGTFTKATVLAITQAICDYRGMHRINGPLYMGKDTHALSGLAQDTAPDVLAGNEVETIIQRENGVTPTSVISRAIRTYSRHAKELADGIVITPSYNPLEDDGLKYNPTHGGPAGTGVTRWIEARANELLRKRNAGVRRLRIVRSGKLTTSWARQWSAAA